MEVFGILLSAVWYFLLILNTRNLGQEWLLKNANYYFYIVLFYIGVFIAIFASQFIGTEYTDGTMRNKLFVGHSRHNVYLANLLVTGAAGFIFLLTHMAVAVLLGVPFTGTAAITAVSLSAWRLCSLALIAVVYAALFTLFAMLDSNKARVSVVTLLLSLAMILCGICVTGKLAEPELTSRMVMQEDGSFQRENGIPNPAYLDGTMRSIFAWMDVSLPSSQALRIANQKMDFDGRLPFCSAGITVLLTFCGVKLFQKKDIR